MPNTDIYKLWYALPGTKTSDYPTADLERFLAIEAQLLELYTIFGNGVVLDRSNKWELLDIVQQTDEGITVYVQPGVGHIEWKVAETQTNTAVNLVIPPGANLTEGLTYYLYASTTETTQYDKSVDFLAFWAPQYNTSYIYLCKLTIGVNENGQYYIKSVDYTGRDEISLSSSLSKFVSNHVHTGGTNPPKINLRLHTTGKLSGEFIEENLDASQITSGKISPDRLPKIPHSNLADIGSLSHPQIDTILGLLSSDEYISLSNITTSNLIRTIISLKFTYANIDESLLNTWVFVPGITDENEYVDLENTTATIDEVNHRIIGELAEPTASYYISWNSSLDFLKAINEYDLTISDYKDSENNPLDTLKRSNNVVVSGDIIYDGISFNLLPIRIQVSSQTGISCIPMIIDVSSSQDNSIIAMNLTIIPTVVRSSAYIELDTPLNFAVVHSKSASYNKWDVSEPKVTMQYPAQNNIPVSATLTIYHTYRFYNRNGVNTYQNWQNRNKLQFGIKLEDAELLQHGDIKLHLIGGRHERLPNETITIVKGATKENIEISGGIVILSSNQQTSQEEDNIYTLTIDLLQFPERNKIYGVCFSISTNDGWDLSPYTIKLCQPPYYKMEEQIREYLMQNDPYSYGNEGNITMYVYNTLYKYNRGFVIFRNVQPVIANWTMIDYDADIPEVDTGIISPSIVIRTRTAQTKSLLPYTSWRTINQDGTINSSPAECIDVIVELNASSDLIHSPKLEKLNLYYSISGEDNRFSWNTTEEFYSYDEISNISIGNNNLYIQSTEGVNNILFIEDNSIQQIASINAINKISIQTDNLYISPIQAFLQLPPGLRRPMYIDITSDGRYIIADTFNDRIIEIDEDGNLYQAIQGNLSLPKLARDFVLLSAIYNSNTGIIYIAFSQNISANIDRTKFRISTIDGANSFYFLSDNDGIFEMFPTSTGKTAVLMIRLSTRRKAQIDTWTGRKVLYIEKGGVYGERGQTASSTLTEQQSSLPEAEIIYDAGYGKITTKIMDTIEQSKDENTFFDFDDNGSIDSTNLIDTSGNVDIANVIIEEGNIVFANIEKPVCVQKTTDETYIIASEASDSIININEKGDIIWSIADTIIRFDADKGGTAFLTSDNTVLCASPMSNSILKIYPVTKSIVYSYQTLYKPYWAIDNEGNIIAIEVDESGRGNSRVFQIDIYDDIIREWGIGKLLYPKSVYRTQDDHWIISC